MTRTQWRLSPRPPGLSPPPVGNVIQINSHKKHRAPRLAWHEAQYELAYFSLLVHAFNLVQMQRHKLHFDAMREDCIITKKIQQFLVGTQPRDIRHGTDWFVCNSDCHASSFYAVAGDYPSKVFCSRAVRERVRASSYTESL